VRIGTRTQNKRAGSRTARRPREGASPPADCESRPAAASAPQRRERDAGGPEDRALYVCRCGSAFQAIVTASVRCPHCGEPQAW
jgi:hypothetical protein